MKVWHDDRREPPNDGWLWAKTNEEAICFLLTGEVYEISLDHDLGAKDGQIRGHSPDGSGYDLVCWMVEHRVFPDRIIIHSHNRKGAQRMARMLAAAGKGCNRRPYNRRFLTSKGVSL